MNLLAEGRAQAAPVIRAECTHNPAADHVQAPEQQREPPTRFSSTTCPIAAPALPQPVPRSAFP
jgi:hypothetical protein